jgi:hypothetical protein
MAKYPNVCLCNDDVVLKNEVFKFLNGCNLEESIIGCHFNNFIAGFNKSVITAHSGHCIGEGWGCVLFFEKKYYRHIDETLKIYCGDDWLVDKFKFCKSLVFDLDFEMSVTSSETNLNEIAQKDIDVFKFLVNKKKIKRIRNLSVKSLKKYLLLKNLFYYIFSLKYEG